MTTQLDPNAIPNDDAGRARLGEDLRQRAREALDRGELITAMLHASDALMLFPNERTYLDLVDHICESTPDPLSTVPVASGAVHPATAAVRARILMTQRKLDEAIALVCRVVDAAPQFAYFEWLTRWLQPHVITKLGWEFLVQNIVRTALRLTSRVSVPAHPKDPRKANVEAAARCFEALRAHYHEPILYSGEAMIRRRLGDPAATVRIALEGVSRFPGDWRCQISALNALADQGRPEQALAHARKAMEIDPSDHAPLRDAAFAFIDAERPGDAVPLLEELLGRQPDYPGAKAALHYTRFRAGGSEDDKRQLLLLREQQHWDEDAQTLAEKVAPSVPFRNTLPGPGDASAAAARHIARELGHVIRCCGVGGEVTYSVRSQFFESPSVGTAFDLAMRTLGARGKLDIAVEQAQSPDPRMDKAGVAYRVWNYQDKTPVRVYPDADPRVKEAIAALARELYDLEAWDAAAARVAQQFGPDWVHAFLALMTDPPPPPEHGGYDAGYWLYRCQIATALVLSQLGPWSDGPGRNAVFALVYGPSDWTTVAGLVALAARARAGGAVQSEVEQVWSWLRGQIPERGFTAWELPLYELWRSLEGLAPERKAQLDEWIERYHETVPQKNVVRPPERRYGGLSLEQYAEFCMERDRILGPVAYEGPTAVINTLGSNPPAPLVELMQRFGLPLQNPQVYNTCFPFIPEWQEALNANPGLLERFNEVKERITFERMGVSGQEKDALDEIRDGNMDMHLRMAQQQAAQRAMNEGNSGDPDPVVFPGQPVAKLSDYVGILKGMQRGDMMGALAAYGLDMMSYGQVATVWGAKLAADPLLNEKFSRMMQS